MSDTVVGANSSKILHSEYGKGEVLGLEMQFSKMLGDVIVENYINNLSEDDMKLITDFITQDLFEYKRDWSSNNPEAMKKFVKENWKEGSSWSSREVKSIGTQIKEMFNARIKEELQKKIEEIVKSSDYQEKIDSIANEIVDYCINGYKEDLKNSIREKLIGNVMNNNQYYGGNSLTEVIHEVVESYIRR